MNKKMFGQLKRVLLSFVYGKLDELSVWWAYRVAQADRHLENKKMSREPAPRDEEEAFERFDQLSIVEADVRFHETRHIERLCVRYGVLLPQNKDRDMYEPFYDSGMVVLTASGKTRLSKEIGFAKKERFEAFRSWALAISGLLGVVTALVSVL